MKKRHRLWRRFSETGCDWLSPPVPCLTFFPQSAFSVLHRGVTGILFSGTLEKSKESRTQAQGKQTRTSERNSQGYLEMAFTLSWVMGSLIPPLTPGSSPECLSHGQ